jgi:RNA polymerase sigma factor (sigma-70 family)
MPEKTNATILYTEENLVASLRARNNEAFSYLYDNYSGALFKAIKQIVIEEECAEDVMQEVFIQIWKKIESYDASKSRLYTWMLCISKNAAIDATRSKSFHKSQVTDKYSEETELCSINNNSSAHIDYIGLEKTLRNLKNIHRKLIELSFFKGYTHEEISQMEKIPVGTVKTRIRYGLNQLKDFWEIENTLLKIAIT